MRFLPALLFLGIISFAQPQQQTPHTKSVDNATDKKKSQPLTEGPAPAAVTREHIAEKSADRGKEEPIGPSNDQRLADYTEKLAEYTKVVAVFTGILIVVGVLQFVALFCQARILTHHSRSLRQSVIQMRRSYRRFVELGEDALELTRGSNETTRAATEATRQSLVLTHRPKVIVRNIVIEPSPMGVPFNPYQSGQRVQGQFFAANVGGMPAKITASHCVLLCNYGMLPMERPYEGKEVSDPLPVGHILSAGKSCPGFLLSITPPKEDFNIPEVFVLGWIEYADDLEPPIVRRTAFCRRFDRNVGRFTVPPVPDPDYEHAE